MNEGVITISRRRLVIGLVIAVLAIALVAIMSTGLLESATEAKTVAPPATLKAQQTAAERDVERAYQKAVEQVRSVRALKLAIPAAQADTVANKALADLKTLRHSAYASLGQVLGMSAADADGYAAATEGRFDQAPVSAQPSAAPVLLAPRLYQIVSKMSDLATQLSDRATADLTAPPGSPSPTSSPRPPSPSPTRP